MGWTPTSAAGNRPTACGFTLVELLVVLAIVAIAAVGVQWAIGGASRQLRSDAEQLAQWLEVVRADARAQAQAAQLSWDSQGIGARTPGLPTRQLRWSSATALQVQIDAQPNAQTWALAPEPVIGAATLRLRRGEQEIVLSTDGFAPFAVEDQR